MTKIKICGLTAPEVLTSMAHLSVDYIGFVFAKSKRQVIPQNAKKMADYARSRFSRPPLVVGVFVNPTIEELADVLSRVELDAVQLHGQESPDFCARVGNKWNVRVFKVFSVSSDAGEGGKAAVRLEPYRGKMDAVLLDTHDPVHAGGTGRTFRWECISEYREWTREAGLPLFVAGGLHAGNVAELIRQYRPDGVDVSSGVETNGAKDIEKITAFVERVRNCGDDAG